MNIRRYNNDRILVISDDHAPFEHPQAIDFLKAVAKEIRPDRVVHLGDMLDSYCFSRYPKSPEAMSTNDELKKARKYVAKLKNLFEHMVICESNHDARLWNRAVSAGIPRHLLVPYLDLLGANHGGWVLKPDLTLTVDSTRDQIYFTHYRGANILTLAQQVGMSAVQGHLHSKMGINWQQTPNRCLWGMQVPCLISDDRYAFAYNKMSMIRPILGVGAIIEGVPKLIRMPQKKSGKWTGRLEI